MHVLTPPITVCRVSRRKVLWLTALNIFLLWLAPTLVSVCVFGCYSLVAGQKLDATTVFTSVALFRLLQEPLRTLPGFISQMLMAKVIAAIAR